MIGMALALFTAVVYALSAVLVRSSLDDSKVFSVVVVLTIISNIILWPLALLSTDLTVVNLEAVLLFLISGTLGFGICRILYYKGMNILGASVNASIIAANPVYSSILAVLFLNEAPTPENWIGIICVVVGVVFIERSLNKPKARFKKNVKKGLVFPLLASLSVAFAFIIRKHGLDIYNEPLLGVAVGNSTSLFIYLPLLISYCSKRGSSVLAKDFRLFWKACLLQILGWISSFYALSYERVSIVTPLLDTQPLFLLLFAYLHLGEREHLSFELIISTISIVTGAILVSTH